MLLRCYLEKDSAENLFLVFSLRRRFDEASFFISFSPVLVSLATSVLGIPITVRKSGERLATRWTVKESEVQVERKLPSSVQLPYCIKVLYKFV